jgi:hypothetical protein
LEGSPVRLEYASHKMLACIMFIKMDSACPEKRKASL